MLRTPTATEGERGHQPESVARARGGQVSLSGQFLPTPVASDSSSNASDGTNGDYSRTVALSLLPTPLVDDSKNTGHNTTRRQTLASTVYGKLDTELMSTPLTTDYKRNASPGTLARNTPGLAAEVHSANWGKFEPAIRQWETITGNQAPAPTIADGKNDTHRLSAAFTEWMMGLPAGWVTDVGLRRNEELKACGNGVVPQQAAMALRHLLERIGNA